MFESILSFKPGLILAIAGIMVCAACKKKKEEKVEPPSDNIYYKDLEPDLKLNSVRTFTAIGPHPQWCSVIIMPADTIASARIDLDGDNTNDFQVIAQHVSEFNPDVCQLQYFITGNFTNSSDYFFRMPGDNSPYTLELPAYYKSGDVLTQDMPGKTMAYFKNHNRPGTNERFLPGEHYIGFVHKNGDAVNVGWMRVEMSKEPDASNDITIKEFAINKTNGNSIVVGQKQ